MGCIKEALTCADSERSPWLTSFFAALSRSALRRSFATRLIDPPHDVIHVATGSYLQSLEQVRNTSSLRLVAWSGALPAPTTFVR